MEAPHGTQRASSAGAEALPSVTELNATTLRRMKFNRLAEVVSKHLHADGSPRDFNFQVELWEALGFDFPYWLAPFHESCPNVCTYLNHRAGYGCNRGKACASKSGKVFDHVCMLCGKKGHGAFSRDKETNSPGCPYWRDILVEFQRISGIYPELFDGYSQDAGLQKLFDLVLANHEPRNRALLTASSHSKAKSVSGDAATRQPQSQPGWKNPPRIQPDTPSSSMVSPPQTRSIPTHLPGEQQQNLEEEVIHLSEHRTKLTSDGQKPIQPENAVSTTAKPSVEVPIAEGVHLIISKCKDQRLGQYPGQSGSRVYSAILRTAISELPVAVKLWPLEGGPRKMKMVNDELRNELTSLDKLRRVGCVVEAKLPEVKIEPVTINNRAWSILIMERCDSNLAQYIQSITHQYPAGGPPGGWHEHDKAIAHQLVLAYSKCHKNKVCHRDVKPENILVRSKPRSSIP